MGAAASVQPSLRAHIEAEVERVQSEDRDYLYIDELVDVSSPEELPLAFDHVATLFTLDVGLTGTWPKEDILRHVHECSQRRRLMHRHEFASRVVGDSVKAMVVAIRERGAGHVVHWFVQALAVRYPPLELPTTEGGTYRLLHLDAVFVLHRVLCLGLVGALSYRDMVDMLQQASEAHGLLNVDDESLDDHVAEAVVRSFLTALLQSYAASLPTITARHAAPSVAV